MIGLAICAYLAPIYMTVRLKGELREDFRKASIAAGLTLGFFTTLAIPVAVYQAPDFAKRLLDSWPTACVALAVVSGVTTQLFLWQRRYRAAQIAGASTVVCTLGGFAASLYPDLLIGELSLASAAAPRPTLVAFLTVLPIGAIVLIPSLFYLYWTFRGEPAPEIPPAGSKSD